MECMVSAVQTVAFEKNYIKLFLKKHMVVEAGKRDLPVHGKVCSVADSDFQLCGFYVCFA